jgi:hypothetical protein
VIKLINQVNQKQGLDLFLIEKTLLAPHTTSLTLGGATGLNAHPKLNE